MWYDKYFHWYQRKSVFDVYLDSDFNGKDILFIVLKNGQKGCTYLPQNAILSIHMQYAYKEANHRPLEESDYKKYLLPTIGTTRPDPRLVSYIEKGYIPGFRK